MTGWFCSRNKMCDWFFFFDGMCIVAQPEGSALHSDVTRSVKLRSKIRYKYISQPNASLCTSQCSTRRDPN